MIHELADLVLGASCPGCGVPRLGLCPACRDALPAGWRPVADAPALGGLTVLAAGCYSSSLRHLLTAHKDRGAWWLTGPLARCLVPPVTALLESSRWRGPVVLAPVPSSVRAVRERGFDHAMALARGVARQLPAAERRRVRVAAPLHRVRAVRDQVGLGRAQRSANQDRSQRARRPPGGVPPRVVLLDDICTTGATLAESARALDAAGWPVLGGAVVAHPQAARANVAHTGNIVLSSGNVGAWHDQSVLGSSRLQPDRVVPCSSGPVAGSRRAAPNKEDPWTSSSPDAISP